MLQTPTSSPEALRPQFLFRCRQCSFKSTDVGAAQLHWSKLKHPYYAEALPRHVVAAVARHGVPMPLPEAPPPESLEQKLQLVSGLLEQLAQLTAEVSSAASGDERTTDTDLPAWMLEFSLDMENEKDELDTFLEDLRSLPSANGATEVAHG